MKEHVRTLEEVMAERDAYRRRVGELHAEGLPALERLFKLAQSDTGQCRVVARFLAGLYNGMRFPFDLTDFRCIDAELFEDAMRVLRMDARACVREVHLYFGPDGGALFEKMIADWGMEKRRKARP